MQSKVRLAVSDAMYLKPLLYGLESPDSPFEPAIDLPAVNSIHLNERTRNIRCAFLSPIDFGRYGGPYRIVPQVAVSSSLPTGTITLAVKPQVRSIKKVAVDIRVTSEIILAKILLLERFRNLPDDRSDLEFLPMMPDHEAMLQKADAALIVNFRPGESTADSDYTLDLVEEWSDMTGFPYVHGFWVAREEDLAETEVQALMKSKMNGVENLDEIATTIAPRVSLPREECREYLESFSYDFGDEQIDSVAEFLKFAYYHGVIGDVPELQFLDTPKGH
jgi:predicted solute-binding protein